MYFIRLEESWTFSYFYKTRIYLKHAVVFMLSSEILVCWGFFSFFFISVTLSNETDRTPVPRRKVKKMTDNVLFRHVYWRKTLHSRNFGIRTGRILFSEVISCCVKLSWEMGAKREGKAEEQWIWICKIRIFNNWNIIRTCSSISLLCRHLFLASTVTSSPVLLLTHWIFQLWAEAKLPTAASLFLQWKWAKALSDKIRWISAILIAFSVQSCSWEKIFTC